MSLTILDHPLARHYLTHLRDVETEPAEFRKLAKQLTSLLVIEATKNIGVTEVSIHTPLEPIQADLVSQSVVAIPILRAGLSMLEAVVELVPEVSVGYIGLERDHETTIANRYYCKLPDMKGKLALCLDPMLATGGSASQAISIIKAQEPESIIMVSVVSAPEGVNRLTNDHPDVKIVTASLDRGLNDKKYILPGLGDFGDRLYGTH